jgi:hypothetical protein
MSRSRRVQGDCRIVPLGNRSPLPQTVRAWTGYSRGRWDGDTLVVDTIRGKYGNRAVELGLVFDAAEEAAQKSERSRR